MHFICLGQYAGRGEKMGYLQDTSISAESNTPTFAVCVLNVRNSRWEGVPFILKAGKALNDRKSEVLLYTECYLPLSIRGFCFRSAFS